MIKKLLLNIATITTLLKPLTLNDMINKYNKLKENDTGYYNIIGINEGESREIDADLYDYIQTAWPTDPEIIHPISIMKQNTQDKLFNYAIAARGWDLNGYNFNYNNYYTCWVSFYNDLGNSNQIAFNVVSEDIGEQDTIYYIDYFYSTSGVIPPEEITLNEDFRFYGGSETDFLLVSSAFDLIWNEPAPEPTAWDDVWDFLSAIVIGLAPILEIELFGFLPIGYLIAIPLIFAILAFILGLFR